MVYWRWLYPLREAYTVFVMLLISLEIVNPRLMIHVIILQMNVKAILNRFRTGTTSKVITGSADNSLRLWDTETGTQLGKYDTRSAVRTCAFSYCGNRVMFSTDKQMGHACEVFFCDIRDSAQLGMHFRCVQALIKCP